MPTEHYIGLMSGTSTDGVDGVLAEFEGAAIQIAAAASLPLPAELRRDLLALNATGLDELARAARAANGLADCYAQIVERLLAESGLAPAGVRAIGAHGQTVRHAPEAGYTLQINAPARLAERTGIAVVADFRSRDVAAGGQGAPLVPAFHAAWFGDRPGRAILNLGGIANVTLLGEPVRGFDTGPANMLMDAWAQRHLGQPYDRDGTWAASGHCHAGLLARLRGEPWFSLAPPKSTGRDLFSPDWLRAHLEATPGTKQLAPEDVQATLLMLSVVTIAEAIDRHAPDTHEVLACGGGALNTALMTALDQALPCRLASTAEHGMPVQSVEALAFAWLARAHIHGHPACLPAVTGARHATIAGCLYPA
ncbi:anhydro-N-acetylmuramic acid kinase [Castellaniella sp. GW247-6E4]|uniref:anhydro-N-acetylmuramic acid kinase n=1 Tax=Castellaniella sp. GW247-6E4 TaxID=3140380 RepID=UPI0033153030